MMSQEKREQIQAHAIAIAELLFDEVPQEQLQTLEDIEVTVRQQILEHVSPAIGFFFIATRTGTTAGRIRTVKSSIGVLNITEQQAKVLQVKPYTQISPHLEKCCLLVSANESYEHSAQDLIMLTGMAVGHSIQQRLVHRQEFNLPKESDTISEISIDGGKVRLRTPKGEQSEWKDYKCISLHEHSVEAFFHDNESLVSWANSQELASIFYCLGDGHPGIWNIVARLGTEDQQSIEILDWYHLKEHLYELGGSIKRLKEVEALLWKGDVDEAISKFSSCQSKLAINFVKYLNDHRSRIVNYGYFQAEGISIGSGPVESSIKQIGRRIKISGAQWETDNVPHVLLHRCAYLNGEFSECEQYIRT